MKERKNIKPIYNEGDWFAVPLRIGGYAVGVIARMKKGRGSKIIFGYFFGPRHETPPSLSDLQNLTPNNAIYTCMFGDLGLHDGSWPVIGPSDHWDRKNWPMPCFYHVDGMSGLTRKILYDEDNPNKKAEVFICDPKEVEGCLEDYLDGSGAVEIVLTEKLKGDLKVVS